MPTFRTVEVTEILAERQGLQRVRVEGAPVGDRAYCLTELTGTVAVGDRVVVNTTAVELGLGTGGWHVVHWNLSHDTVQHPGPDHIMKLRYTSLQFDAGTDELAHPDLPETLDGTVVVATMVHSQLAAVAAVLKHLEPDLRVGYVMTDGAALPIALSDLVADLRTRGLIDVTVTTGHAFGGDLEAVSVPSGLLLARHVGDADILLAGMGPGVVGTGTRYGTTAVEVAPILDAADALGGEPVLCIRASSGDHRDRHLGISHHTRTVLDLLGCRPWVPAGSMDSEGGAARRLEVDAPDTVALLAELGLAVTTMGRLPEQDRLFFDTAGAVAAVALRLRAMRQPRSVDRLDT